MVITTKGKNGTNYRRCCGGLLRFHVMKSWSRVLWSMWSVAILLSGLLVVSSIVVMRGQNASQAAALLSGIGSPTSISSLQLIEPVAVIAGFVGAKILVAPEIAVPVFLLEKKRHRIFGALVFVIGALCWSLTFVGLLATNGVQSLILGENYSLEAMLSAVLKLALAALICTSRVLIAVGLVVLCNGVGAGAVVYGLTYFLFPVLVAQLPFATAVRGFMPSIVGYSVFDPMSVGNPWISVALSIGYCVTTLVLAAVALNRRDL